MNNKMNNISEKYPGTGKYPAATGTAMVLAGSITVHRWISLGLRKNGANLTNKLLDGIDSAIDRAKASCQTVRRLPYMLDMFARGCMP
ncbi:hypothetical protein N7465_001593 [Penicillium sp. CMV-2018d]|nr:hypothetical protein N7465_001593 [Penicillium sp. CMV-2018d]